MSEEIPNSESFTVEFKSDVRKLSDKDLALAAVCLANSKGGQIYLGVENGGEVTGLHPEHENVTGLAAAISNRTVPSLGVRCVILTVGGKRVARIDVPRSERLVATSDGTLQRRRLLADGSPTCVPFLPHEFVTRESDLRRADYSALPVLGATAEDLDPLERERLRRAIERYHGDRTLLALSDEELDGAMGLCANHDGARVPTVAGILLLGKEAAIREHLPTHEVAFQVLEGEDVRLNEFFRTPLLRLFERLEDLFAARVSEREVQVGLFRVPIPAIDPRAWREAVINALTHRDYTRLGAVHVRLQDDRLVVSNPGGFVEGVRLDNILTVEPIPRNPLLADAFKRVGLAERTGRGVDLIYRGLLGYGRPAPSYSRSSESAVVLEMSCGEADLGFVELVVEEERRLQSPLPIDSLLVLDLLRRERRTEVEEVARTIQKDSRAARAVLEGLVETGLVVAHGVRRGRSYTLGAKVYRRLGQADRFVRQAGFEPLQNEEMIKRFVKEHREVRRRDVMDLCRLTGPQATRVLGRLEEEGVLERRGVGKATHYVSGRKI